MQIQKIKTEGTEFRGKKQNLEEKSIYILQCPNFLGIWVVLQSFSGIIREALPTLKGEM